MEIIMTKKEIYEARSQVHNAWTSAYNSDATYSPLIRMEWKNCGYIPVSPWNYNAPVNPYFRGAERPRLGEEY
jgi:hypothetical protein